MFEHTGTVQVHLTAPPASGPFYFLEKRRINRYANLCQICARALLIWTFWRIWSTKEQFGYVGSTGVGVPIPFLATTSIRPSSVSGNGVTLAETRVRDR